VTKLLKLSLLCFHSLRVQLGLEKLSSGRSSSASISGPPVESGEKPGNEQRLSRLRNDAENKRNAIRNLKDALQKLDLSPTLDIDSRIRQAELEYALGREELQLLSIIEEARAVQGRLEKDKQKADVSSLFALMRNGHQLTLHNVQASTGRWNAGQKHDCGDGVYVDWVIEGEELQRGDRIIEINGRILSGRSKDELQKMCSNTSKCDLVVIRKRSVSMQNLIPPASNQQLQQTQADNMRLQHRISYLEEQVKELLDVQKEKLSPVMSTGSQRSGTHITSISISSSPSDHINGPYQTRESSRDSEKATTPKSIKSLSSSMSKISISTDLHVQRQRREREKKERDRYYNNKNTSKSSQQM
jgi:sulfur dioxygenase